MARRRSHKSVKVDSISTGATKNKCLVFNTYGYTVNMLVESKQVNNKSINESSNLVPVELSRISLRSNLNRPEGTTI